MIEEIMCISSFRKVNQNKLIEKSREWHNHKPQPTTDTKVVFAADGVFFIMGLLLVLIFSQINH